MSATTIRKAGCARIVRKGRKHVRLEIEGERCRESFNGGYHDARFDRLNGAKDRRQIPPGELFALPDWSAAYREGYALGWESPNNPMLEGQSASSEEAWVVSETVKVCRCPDRSALHRMMV